MLCDPNPEGTSGKSEEFGITKTGSGGDGQIDQDGGFHHLLWSRRPVEAQGTKYLATLPPSHLTKLLASNPKSCLSCLCLGLSTKL